MKIKTNVFIVSLFFIPVVVFCQDTNNSSKTETKLHKFFHPENKNIVTTQDSSKSIAPATTAIQTPTLIDSTQRNDNKLAGNNPLSNSSSPTKNYTNQPAATPTLPVIPPENNNTIYRDTRLGSSSPLYNTYKKNDNGAGAVTTNPNKG